MNLKVKEAAKLMEVSEQFIRIGLQRGLLPFGDALLMSNGKYKYNINSENFIIYLRENKKLLNKNKQKDIEKEIDLLKFKIVNILIKNVNSLRTCESEIELLKLIFDYEKSINKKEA